MNAIAFALSLLSPLQSGEVQTFTVNGVERTALVYRNSKPAPKEGSPLVFGFHGHGGNMRNAARSFQMHELWPEAVVVYMQGLPSKSPRVDSEGKRPGWQVARNDLEGRDLHFFDAVLAQIRKEHKIDGRRIYAMGHSNGGRFTYVLWATRGDVFAAFGPSGSPAFGLLSDFKPKPVFHIAGETDALVPYAGQKQTIEQLRRLLGTDPAKEKKNGFLTTEPGPNGLELATYIIPGGHTYPREANALLVEFFKRHPLIL